MLVGAFSLEQLCVVAESGSVQPTLGGQCEEKWRQIGNKMKLWFFLGGTQRGGSRESHSGSRDAVYLFRASPAGTHVGFWAG